MAKMYSGRRVFILLLSWDKAIIFELVLHLSIPLSKRLCVMYSDGLCCPNIYNGCFYNRHVSLHVLNWKINGLVSIGTTSQNQWAFVTSWGQPAYMKFSKRVHVYKPGFGNWASKCLNLHMHKFAYMHYDYQVSIYSIRHPNDTLKCCWPA